MNPLLKAIAQGNWDMFGSRIFHFNPPGTSGTGKDGALSALSNWLIFYTNYTSIHKPKPSHSGHCPSTMVTADTYEGW